MNRLFISQNITNKKTVKSYLHYYGPYTDYKNETIVYNKVLIGISFDSPINFNDQGKFCHLTFTFNYATGSSSTPMLNSTSVDLDISIGTLEDNPVLPDSVLGKNTHFVFPVSVQGSDKLDPLLWVTDPTNVKLNMYAPEQNATYVAPTTFTIDDKILPVLNQLFIDASHANDWSATYRYGLLNSSTGDLLTSYQLDVDTASLYYSGFRLKLCDKEKFLSSFIRPRIDLYINKADSSLTSSTITQFKNFICTSDEYSRELLYNKTNTVDIGTYTTTGQWLMDIGLYGVGGATTDVYGNYLLSMHRSTITPK